VVHVVLAGASLRSYPSPHRYAVGSRREPMLRLKLA